MATIEISDLKKVFGKVTAVAGINLTIPEGEIFGFLGPNGAGKTTTIACMLNFLHPDKGTVRINGLDSQAEEVQIKDITGYIPADPYFYSNWSGKDHIRYVEALRGKAELKTDLIKDLDFNTRPKIHTLSTGNRQKLSIILALMHAPRILILDEPTRGLDPLLQNKFYSYLKLLQKRGTTIFMSSHNLAEVEAVCTRVGIIREGKLVEVSSLQDLRAKRMHVISVDFEANAGFAPALLKSGQIDLITHTGTHYEFKVAGDLNPLLKLLAKYRLSDLNISKASLEDIFLEFYK